MSGLSVRGATAAGQYALAAVHSEAPNNDTDHPARLTPGPPSQVFDRGHPS